MKLADDQEPATPGVDTHAAHARAVVVLSALVATHAGRLVRSFYAAFLAQPEAKSFLDREVVETRLVPSLERWLGELFSVSGEVDGAVATQRRIGEIHARIKVPFHLVMAGSALLKRELSGLLAAAEMECATRVAALVHLNERMDWALSLMSEAYMQGSVRRAQVDEAFRLFAIGHDITLERETQHAALMEWLQSTLFTLFEHEVEPVLKPLGKSPFGLWLHHRAGLMFQGSQGLNVIRDNVRRIDADLLPQLLRARGDRGGLLRELLARLRGTVEEIKFVLSDLFQAAIGAEGGRDPLTQALNRRFLPTILGREISLADQGDLPLTVVMVDVDHFKQVNDRWGHSTGDLVLQQVAGVIMDTVRFNDFVFRYGGEEFLIVLVETPAEEAAIVAERLRAQMEERKLRLADGSFVQVTASIGIAAYKGHPDYARLIEAADRALYRAKTDGRNRVVIATDESAAAVERR
ncbi:MULTISPECIES: GGDEF domain-containing protein [unclassified Xanthobacter]|uniref:GGDEF domain-containing protein n=1 Tax=unclassified Xanthobacter TaxID=2623496 RepID=UPI001EDCF095|nr:MULTISPECIES: GGDEF domain-containing protein [unclassified Xanthobacter]